MGDRTGLPPAACDSRGPSRVSGGPDPPASPCPSPVSPSPRALPGFAPGCRWPLGPRRPHARRPQGPDTAAGRQAPLPEPVQAGAYQPLPVAPGGPAVQTTSSERPTATVQTSEWPRHHAPQPLWAAAPGPPESRPRSDASASPRGDDLGRKRPRSLLIDLPELCQAIGENARTIYTDISF